MVWLTKKWKSLLGLISLRPLMGLSAVFLAGIIFWGGFNWSLEITNTEQFCISCHEMRNYVYLEYKKTNHYANRTGVRASCPDCHVPREWIHKVVRKVAATNELFHWLAGSIDTPGKFEAKRLELARNVWASMEASDSRECRNCHELDFMSAGQQTPKTFMIHRLAEMWETTCIECHQGIAHSLPKGFDREAAMDTLHDRMKREKV
ncbi:MAG: NapC/NirT family cytochrome c, partial [Rhodospirillales bacterium]